MTSYRLSLSAEQDFASVLRYTARRWGVAQARNYGQALIRCVEIMAIDRSKAHSIGGMEEPVLYLRCQHHYIIALASDGPLLVIAILHERMDMLSRVRHRLGMGEN